jgi:hypothetical protein
MLCSVEGSSNYTLYFLGARSTSFFISTGAGLTRGMKLKDVDWLLLLSSFNEKGSTAFDPPANGLLYDFYSSMTAVTGLRSSFKLKEIGSGYY